MNKKEIVIEQTTNQASAIELAAWLSAKNPVVSSIHHQIIVAGGVERDGRYLVIEEMAEGRRVINQPAGRLEKDESASDGAMRETLEESGYLFMAEALVGLYHWFHPEKNTLYLRMAFTGQLIDQGEVKPLDREILAVRWMSIAELEAESERLRSPFVLQCIRDHAQGIRFPLDVVRYFPNDYAQS